MRSSPGWCVLAVLAVLSVAPGSGKGEVVSLERELLPLRRGLSLVFEAQMGAHEPMEIHVQTGEFGEERGLSFVWKALAGKRLRERASGRFVSAIQDGRHLGRLVQRRRSQKGRDTFFWLGREACMEIEATGKTQFSLGSGYKRRRTEAFERVRTSSFEAEVDGRFAAFPVWELRAARAEQGEADYMMVLADCRNPLVVYVDAPRRRMHFKLSRVRRGEQGRGW